MKTTLDYVIYGVKILSYKHSLKGVLLTSNRRLVIGSKIKLT